MVLMKKLLTIALLSFCLMACKKENDTTPIPEISKLSPEMQLLVGNGSKGWQLVSFVHDGIEGTFNECDYDDLYTFKRDSTFVLDYGAIECGIDFPNYTGKWYIKEKNKFVTILGSESIVRESTIHELTSETFKTTITDKDSFTGKEHTQVLTYKAK